MRLELRRLHANELDHELIWFLVTLSACAVGGVWLWLQLPLPRCSFRMITGFPCLTCGSTRATLALLRGDLATAFSFNPLALATLCALAVYNVYAASLLVTGARRIRRTDGGRIFGRVFVSVLVALALCNWFYLLTR